ncbi:MAG: hypothetical protein QXE31_06255 [Candidatus Woesearchaeota archaeon]
MIIKIKRYIVETYGDLIKESSIKLIGDLLIIIGSLMMVIGIRDYFKDSIIEILNVSYRVDVLLYYLVAFIIIISTNILFKDLKNFLNIISTFIITRFPKMKNETSPEKFILRDLVQILILFLLFYPLSEYTKNISFYGIQIIYIVSLLFIILTMIFIYHIIKNIFIILNNHFENFAKNITKKTSLKNEDQHH